MPPTFTIFVAELPAFRTPSWLIIPPTIALTAFADKIIWPPSTSIAFLFSIKLLMSCGSLEMVMSS